MKLIKLNNTVQVETYDINFLTEKGLLQADRCCIKCGSVRKLHLIDKEDRWRCNTKK